MIFQSQISTQHEKAYTSHRISLKNIKCWINLYILYYKILLDPKRLCFLFLLNANDFASISSSIILHIHMREGHLIEFLSCGSWRWQHEEFYFILLFSGLEISSSKCVSQLVQLISYHYYYEHPAQKKIIQFLMILLLLFFAHFYTSFSRDGRMKEERERVKKKEYSVWFRVWMWGERNEMKKRLYWGNSSIIIIKRASRQAKQQIQRL
jgi:hypothetical protein